MKQYVLFLALSSMFALSTAFADDVSANNAEYKQSFFYGGLMGGYADADWSSVVTDPSTNSGNNLAVDLSSPYAATGTGFAYGVDLGYQFSTYFDVEGQYIRMPTSQLSFLTGNWFNEDIPLNLYGITSPTINSNMDFWSIIFKVMTPLGHTGFSLFIDAGPAYQYQTNQIADIGTFAPTFGGGTDYRINQHWFAEFSFEYAPGTGKSILLPLTAFVPEIYVETFRVNYIF